MIKVIMVLPRYFPILGGAEVQCARLIDKFESHKDRVEVVGVVTRQLTCLLAKSEKIGNLNIRRLPPIGMGLLSEYFFCLTLFFYLLFHRNKYDVIHCHATAIFGITCSLVGYITNKKVILKVSTNGEVHNMTNGRWKRRIVSFFSNYCTYIALNRQGYDEVVKCIPNAKVRLIPNGIDYTSEKDVTAAQKIRSFLNERIGYKAKIGIFVGRFVKRKGINDLIKASEIVNRYLKKDVFFILIGDSELQRDGEVFFKDNKNIISLGKKENVFPYLLASDFFISPSHNEGLPNTVLEALSSGKKCLLSDISPHEELAEEHPEYIKLFKTGCPESMADRIVEFIGSEAEKFCLLSGTNLLAPRYHMDEVCEKYIRLYLE